MSESKQKTIVFPGETLEMIEETRKIDHRTFAGQVVALVEEALKARQIKESA